MCFNDLNNITLEFLLNYLKFKNWHKDDAFPNKNLILFKKYYDDESYSLTIPSKETFKDFKRRLDYAIELLSELDEDSEQNIINEIIIYNNHLKNNFKIQSAKDRLSFRIKSDISQDGSLPLDYANSILTGIKKLFASAIYAEKNNPTPVLDNNFKSVSGELKHYKLAQTAIGSYIFNIDINSSDTNSQFSFDFDKNNYITTSRKVIRRIQNGINDVYTALENNSLDSLYEKGYETGLNANMCDALLEFKTTINSVIIESKVEWDPTFPAPKDIKEKVLINNNDFEIFESISKKYKEKRIENITISGFIIEMHNNFNDKSSKKFSRYIILASLIDNSTKKVKVNLNEDDYLIACKAHSTKSLVSVNGEIIPRSKVNLLNNYKNFRII